MVWDCSAKKEGGRLVKVGREKERFIILKRVGDHYHLIYREDEDGRTSGIFAREDLSEETLGFWRLL